jgi:hypothetical protein
MEYFTPSNVINVSLGTVFSMRSKRLITPCNTRGIVESAVFCWVRPDIQLRVVSPQLAVGRHTRRRSSQRVALGGGAPIFVSHLRSNSEFSCETDASQRGQKSLKTEAEGFAALEAVT